MNRGTVQQDIWQYRDDPPTEIDMAAFWKVVAELTYYSSQTPYRRGYEVLRLLYNEDGSPTEMTLKEAGKKIGVSTNRIAQNRDKAFAMLRNSKRRELYEIKKEGKEMIEGPKQDRRQRYLVWRKMENPPSQKNGYSASEADFLHLSARLQLLITFDKETGEETHRGCDIRFDIGGDAIGYKSGVYEVLLPWLQDRIDQAIRDNLRAIKDKQDIQVENP